MRHERKSSAGSRISQTVIKKILKIKMYTKFKDNIWVADLPKMGSLSLKNGGLSFHQVCLS